jgi:hypothetical protein
MRIRQRVYFRIWSETISASQVTGRLGIESDAFSVRGSRIAQPPVPKGDQWTVSCDEPGLRIDEQMARVLDRLEPYRDKIAALVTDVARSDPPGAAELQVVRYFDDEEGEEESEQETRQPDGSVFERLPGQHQLLGWHLDTRTIAFLRDVGAELDVDEYGL